jgi:hypothetical protein
MHNLEIASSVLHDGLLDKYIYCSEDTGIVSLKIV